VCEGQLSQSSMQKHLILIDTLGRYHRHFGATGTPRRALYILPNIVCKPLSMFAHRIVKSLKFMGLSHDNTLCEFFLLDKKPEVYRTNPHTKIAKAFGLKVPMYPDNNSTERRNLFRCAECIRNDGTFCVRSCWLSL
jgi:hypothetical protein